MRKEKKDKHFLKKPVYDGGPKAMKAFVNENLKYPKEAFENKIEGTVSLKYTINHKGEVISTKVISSLGHGCDEEAQRVVGLLKFEVPKNRGVRVLFHKSIQIHFRLPKAKPKQFSPATIQYTVTKTPKKEEKKKDKKGGGYSYTIEF